MDQVKHPARRNPCHRLPVVEIPFQDEFPVAVNMQMARGMIAFPFYQSITR